MTHQEAMQGTAAVEPCQGPLTDEKPAWFGDVAWTSYRCDGCGRLV
jgi:hypothetical protein